VASARVGRLIGTVLLTSLVACGQSGQRVASRNDAPEPSTSTTLTAASARNAPDGLGPGSWTEARTANHGRGIVILFVGGPEYDPANPCTVDYRLEVEETSSQVRVRISGTHPPDRRPPPPSGIAYSCTSEGHFRSVTADLAQPLGSRQLVDVDFNRVQPVFDGDALATVTWLPDGWHEQREDAITSGNALTWGRWFGPDRPPPTGNRCSPTDAAIVLREAQANGAGNPPGGENLRGTKAFYSEDAASGPNLSWVEHGRLYSVASTPGCAGDRFPTKETLFHFAEALTIP
jgi:hypothetical protein